MIVSYQGGSHLSVRNPLAIFTPGEAGTDGLLYRFSIV